MCGRLLWNVSEGEGRRQMAEDGRRWQKANGRRQTAEGKRISCAVYKNATKKIILHLLNDLQIIDCNHATALTAANSDFDDLEDALQYYTALQHDTDYFISSDKLIKNFALPHLPVYSAKELLMELAFI